MENIALSNGYVAKGFGYVKNIDDVMHWITFFESGKVQLYAYYSFDVNEEVYNTGVIETSEEELKTLITIFNRNN